MFVFRKIFHPGYLGIIAIFFSLSAFSQGQPAIIKETSGDLKSQVSHLFERIDPATLETGILHDRVLSFVNTDNYQGHVSDTPGNTRDWEQLYFELFHSAVENKTMQPISAIKQLARPFLKQYVLPIGILNFRYNKIKPDARERGLLVLDNDQFIDNAPEGVSTFDTKRAFAAAVLKKSILRSKVTFLIDERFYFSNTGEAIEKIEIDFADGQGFRQVTMGEQIVIHYPTVGEKVLQIQIQYDNTTLATSFQFEVKQQSGVIEANPPDIYWENEVSNYSYLDEFAVYDGYVFLGDGNSDIDKPIVFVEGFDLADTYGWMEIYDLLNTENLASDLRTQGFDLIIMNFQNATDYLQRNSYAFVSLVEKVNSEKVGDAPLVIGGASMGGLITRYGLSWMETNAIDHEAIMWLTFDTPHQGANMPLGVQFMAEFFSAHVSSIDELLQKLNSPGAQQMLVYHHLNSPEPSVNVLKTQWEQDLAAAGSYPSAEMWKVGISNGSGVGNAGHQVGYSNQPMNPGSQIVDYYYYSWLVEIRGNVWAIPNISPQIQIFEGLVDLLWPLPDDDLDVFITGTSPYDNAPGGTSNTMEELTMQDTGGWGTIATDYPNHCFIPTVSSLDLRDVSSAPLDLFYDLSNDPDLLSKTFFDTIYFPTTATNEEHVSVNIGNAPFIYNEIMTATAPYVTVDAKVFLQGPYLAAQEMSTILEDNTLLPLQNPYNTSPWNYDGTESVAAIADSVVDWVLLSLRNAPASEALVTRAAFLKANGQIVDLDGSSPVRFENIDEGNYYMVISHRNHLAIMSAAALPLSKESAAVDFSAAQTQAYGLTPLFEVESGIFAMHCGDGNADNGVDALDKNIIWRPQNGTVWEYGKLGDYNLDGGIDALDLNLGWRVTNGSASQVP